ncbi:methionyl-tRNA formyltransferase, partial [Candidatus Margulisiibacteriota bacterium]
MKIVFMGTPETSLPALEALLAARHEILCVVTQPDRPRGRGQKITPTPVKELALKHGLAIEQPEKVRGNQVFISQLKSLAPDIIVVVAYGKILPKEILDIPRYGCVNVHASLLPKYRGAAPVQWALLNGEKETGVTVMRLDELLDTGDIILQEKISINEDDNTPGLTKKIFERGSPLLTRALELIAADQAKYLGQDDRAASQAPAIAKESGEIDWRRSADEVHNRVRAMVPWPCAHTFRREKLLKIWRSERHVLDLAGKPRLPGTIVQIVKK